MTKSNEKTIHLYSMKVDKKTYAIWKGWSRKLDTPISDILKKAMEEYLARIASRPLEKLKQDYNEIL